MVVVIIDTSIIGLDFNLEGLSFQLIFDNRHLTGHSVAVPEVVVQESVNQFRERLAAEMGKLAAATREAGKLTGDKLALPKLDQSRR